jgi:hypothetical protein
VTYGSTTLGVPSSASNGPFNGPFNGSSNGSLFSQTDPLTPSRPRFLVLDFTHVASVDATAVHSCFAAIARITQGLDVQLVYAACQVRPKKH